MGDNIRAYERERDLDAVTRIWREVGWIDASDGQKKALDSFLSGANAEVAIADGEAECMVHWTPGTINYLTEPLRLCAVSAVTTSHIGRKQGFASALTARALQQGAEAGCAVAALGMFEQGFYDRLGFGTGAYDHEVWFDPGSLRVQGVEYRVPIRLGPDDAADVAAAMSNRLRFHGGVVIDSVAAVGAELTWAENGYALGYRDADGRLTHFVAGTLADEHGPFKINAIGYESTDQLLELLRLLYELGDQIHTVRLIEPPEIQLQVLLNEPMRQRSRTRNTPIESGVRSIAWWQARVLDLERCVAARRWEGPEVRLNLILDDPLAQRVESGWSGIGGEYTVAIGEESKVALGTTEGLPTLVTGVGSFTRLWFAVRSATSLSVTDDLSAPPELLAQLDAALNMPPPVAGWLF